MVLRTACSLFVALVACPSFASGPVALAGQWVSGNTAARVSTAGETSQGSVHTSLHFGPSFDCFAPMAVDRFSLTLFGPGRILGGSGSWHTTSGGRPALALDPLSFEDELGDAYRSACEESLPPEACAEALAALDPRLVRSQIEIRPRERGGSRRAQLRGRIELELFDPVSETVAFSWSLAFRNEGALELNQPASFGFCGVFYSLTFVAPGR